MKTQNNRDKYFYQFMAELYRLDSDDHFTLEDHVFLTGVECITNESVGRAIQVSRDTYTVNLNYIDGNGKVKNTHVYDAIHMAQLTFDFLMGHTRDIQYDN